MHPQDTSRLTLSISRETDLALRSFLGAQGMRKGDLSKFVEEAVRRHLFEQTVRIVKDRHVGMDAEQLQQQIDAALSDVRRELHPAR